MTNPPASSLITEALQLERHAHDLRSRNQINEAFEAYDKAAGIYKDQEEHLKAAFCYASAATCWNILTGQQPLRQAASRSHLAACEAVKARHYDYARSLFRDAAMLYEKEGDFENFSSCIFESERVKGRSSWEMMRHFKTDTGLPISFHDRIRAFLKWGVNTISYLIWGYGEKPFQTLWTSLSVILISAVLYASSGQILSGGSVRSVTYPEAIYFSSITFTTVGYGDYLPIGWTRIVAALEAASGILLTPVFLIGLTRKYLRVSR